MASLTVIGGNSYRWRGKAIRTIRKNNATCVTMPRRDSTIMAPCSVNENTYYKVTVTALKNSGNGALLINFFGGRAYDGNPVPLNVTSTEMRDYTIVVRAPGFPKSVSMCLRVRRSDRATGNVYIKLIRFEVTSNVSKTIKESRLPVITDSKRSAERDNRPGWRIKNKKKRPPKSSLKLNPRRSIGSRENKIMKFKPYKVRKPTAMASKVFVKNPDDVPKVSIITPTRDGVELIKKCYSAINKNTSYPNWEWIIGDSASTDKTVKCIKSWNDSRIKLVERGTVVGSFSSINNELVSFATGEYLLFLNDDTQPQPFWLYKMMSKIHGYPKVGVVGARLEYSKGRVQHAGIAFIPQGPANLGKSVLKSFPKKFADYDRCYQAVTGACFLMRTEDFKAVDGFDPIYYFCYEDVDLCLKIRDRLEKEVIYVADAIVYHTESVTQKKHKTASPEQKVGIAEFKKRWMKKVEIDFPRFQKNIQKGLRKIDISFVTCVNDIEQYNKYVVGSLFKSNTKKIYETIPVFNFGNPYSAAEALNIGIKRARADIVVLCHQDVLFYEEWVDMLFERIKEIEENTKKWGVLGTAGITNKEDTIGVVHNMKGRLQWQPTRRVRVGQVQTVDEHCMIIRKSSGLRFDSKTFDGFHFYGIDLALNAFNKGFKNFGILCPLVHASGSGSLGSGEKEFKKALKALAEKWKSRFPHIRTPTSVINRNSVQTFVTFTK